MKLRNLYERPGKVAAFAVGRMNPATTGHELLVNKIKEQPGDPFLFLTDRAPKLPDNPLTSEEKLDWARKSFNGISIGLAKTVLLAADRLSKLGYDEVTFLEGEDKLYNLIKQYNGVKTDKHYYNFNKINYVQLKRDPEAGDATGMSGTKLRSYVTNNDLESFKKGVTDSAQPFAEDMFKKLQGLLGVDPVDENINEYAAPVINAIRTVSPHAWKGMKWVSGWMKRNPKSTLAVGTLPWTGPILSTMAGIFGLLGKYYIPIGLAVTLLIGGKALWELLKDKDPDSVTEEELKEILKKYEPKEDADLEELKRRLEKATGKKLNDIKENINISEYSVKQQLPKIEVLNNIASRKDNSPFPLSYKSTGGASTGGQVYVSPEAARKFIGFYEKRAPDEQELMRKALKSVSGVRNLFNNIGLNIDVKYDKPKDVGEPKVPKNPLDSLLDD